MTDPAPTPAALDPAPSSTPVVIVQRDERTIRLGDLGTARENLRHGEPPDDEIPNLAATLRAAGQLQRLTVRPGRGKSEDRWMALDGRRRRLALGLLRDAGEIDDDYPVEVYVETDPARQAAAVLLTNTAVPVHVADVIAAIGRMLKSKLTVAVIAGALGYTELEIKRLAALAALPPVALAALKAGRLTLRQARLLARLPDKVEQVELAQMTLDGHAFQEWRVTERLDGSRVTSRDRRCAMVDPETYAAAGGRTETDLFGELAPVLLDPDILTRAWMKRARGIAAVFEAEGIAVHVTAGPEPDLPEDLEALGYVYGGSLPAEDRSRYSAQREIYNERVETAREALADPGRPDLADLAIVDMIHARIAADQTGCGGRIVTTMVMWPSTGCGVEVRCYTPEVPEPEIDVADLEDDPAARPARAPAYEPPAVAVAAPDIEGVNHALHGVRTDMATRGLIRALADDPGAALTALIARLFKLLVLRIDVARSESALSLLATAYTPAGGRVVEALDGAVRQRLDERQAAWQASGQTVIAWIHALPHGEKMGVLAELTALSLDVREERTTLIRRRARAEATELAALCDADITVHWTPDAPFLQSHPKGLLLGMLETMEARDERAAGLKKTELVDWVTEQAAARAWAPASLSWKAAPEADGAGSSDPGSRPEDDPPSDLDGDGGQGEPAAETLDDGAGAFTVTPDGEAALSSAAA